MYIWVMKLFSDYSILLGRSLQICLVDQMEIQWVTLNFIPLILLMI